MAPCVVIVVSEGLLTPNRDIMLVMSMFGSVRSVSDNNAFGVIIFKQKHQCLGHALRMTAQRLPYHALCVKDGTWWKKQISGYLMKRHCGKKESCTGSLHVNPS